MPGRAVKLGQISFLSLLLFFGGGCASLKAQMEQIKASKAQLSLDKLQEDTFRFFWETTNPETGLAPDRYPSDSPASVAGMGFALTAYGIGVERGFISRKDAGERTLATLRYLTDLPMGPERTGKAGYQGFYYHFLQMSDGTRNMRWQVELSTIDTALLMAGVLFAQTYFDGESEVEAKIRDLADFLYTRVNWPWAQNFPPLLTLGWQPESGFLPYDWAGYSEGMLLYILALGSPTHPIEKNAWDKWAEHYADDWVKDNGYEYLTFSPMFGHQYSHAWIDFRGIQDDYMRSKKSDYFKNSRLAAYAQRQYAIRNPGGWAGYGENFWGLTASDGPGNFVIGSGRGAKQYWAYLARGVGPHSAHDDGTIAPTAFLGSMPFAPEIVLPALNAVYAKYGEHIYGKYGFLDAFNPSFQHDLPSPTGKVVPGLGWFSHDYIGIDQGPILVMTENHRSGFVWNVMRKNPYIRAGLKKAGFKGGWLEE
jgi:hypothetical protein